MDDVTFFQDLACTFLVEQEWRPETVRARMARNVPGEVAMVKHVFEKARRGDVTRAQVEAWTTISFDDDDEYHAFMEDLYAYLFNGGPDPLSPTPSM
ncbi:MAG: hypothetical protein AAFV53_20830 [Myxococcota bacterium]